MPPPEALLRHATFVRRLARLLTREANEADDLVQETWLTALTRPPRHAAHLGAWLARVVASRAKSARRARGRREAHEEAARETRDAPSAGEQAAQAELLVKVSEAVVALPEPYRGTLLERYYHDRTSAEIARAEGVSPSTVRMRLVRGLERLREELDRRCGQRDSWLPALGLLADRHEVHAAAVGAGAISLATTWKIAGAAVLAGALLVGARALVHPVLEGGRPPSSGVAGPSELATLPGKETSSAPLATAPAAEARVPVAVEEELASAAPSPTCALRILDPDESPAARRRVAVVDARGPQEHASDEEGRLLLPASGEEVTLVVARRDGPPAHVPVELEPGERVVQLPRGAELSGRILVYGEAPGERLRLLGYASEEPGGSKYWNDENGLPVFVDEDPPFTTWSDESGAFAFHGLPDDWKGKVRVPAPYRRPGSDCGARGKLFFERPASGVVVELERCFALTGRLLRADGSPATEGWLDLRVQVDAWNTMDIGGRVREGYGDGSFVIPMDRRPTNLWGQLGESPGRRFVTTLTREVPEDGLLGELLLESGRALVLLVRDGDGLPIAGARTSVDSEPTDDEGRTVIPGLGEDAGPLGVYAAGFLRREVTVEPDDPGPVSVTLEETNVLQLDVVDRHGEPLAGLELVLAAGGGLFVSEDDVYEAYVDPYPGRWKEAQRGADGTICMEVLTDSGGRFGIGGLQARPLDITATSDDGVEILRERVRPLGARERLERRLEVSLPVEPFAGRVVDESEAPIAGAIVTVGSGSRSAAADGRFRLPHVCAEAGPLSVQAEGFLPLEIAHHTYRGEDHVFRLRRGLDVTVRVRDEAGKTLVGGELEARDPRTGRAVRGRAGESGSFAVRGIEDGTQEVTLRLAGRSFVRWLDPRKPELELVLPVPGRVEVHGVPLAADGRTASIELHGVEPESSRLRGRSSDPDECAFDVVFPGSYELRVVHPLEGTPLREPVSVEVESGRTASVRLP